MLTHIKLNTHEENTKHQAGRESQAVSGLVCKNLGIAQAPFVSLVSKLKGKPQSDACRTNVSLHSIKWHAQQFCSVRMLFATNIIVLSCTLRSITKDLMEQGGLCFIRAQRGS